MQIQVKYSLTKIETPYIVALLNVTKCRLQSTNTENVDTILLFLSSYRQFFVDDPKVHDFRYRK